MRNDSSCSGAPAQDLGGLARALRASGFSADVQNPCLTDSAAANACSYILDDGRSCSNRGKSSHGGAWFCGHHHPEVQAARRHKRELRWVARLRPLPAGQARLTPEQCADLGLPLLSCDSCQSAVVNELERVVQALEPFERDGKLPIPGLESLMATRDVLARARNGLMGRALPSPDLRSDTLPGTSFETAS